jgi:hypothetical protein
MSKQETQKLTSKVERDLQQANRPPGSLKPEIIVLKTVTWRMALER